jgi:sulfur-carrier protein
MAVEVRVPTILRNYTAGEKVVTASGASLAEVIEHLEADHPGIKGRLIENEDLRRFVNVYVNDEDVRFTGGLGTSVDDGDAVVILPAVAGGT